jgi:hypothetical protein
VEKMSDSAPKTFVIRQRNSVFLTKIVTSTPQSFSLLLAKGRFAQKGSNCRRFRLAATRHQECRFFSNARPGACGVDRSRFDGFLYVRVTRKFVSAG